MKKCEQCGMEFNEDYAFCTSCGGDLVDFEPPEEEKIEEAIEDIEVVEDVKGNLCPECGTEIPDGYVFCPECGTKIEKDEDPIEEEEVKENICPECGTEIPDGYVFCPECGKKVVEDNPAEEKIQERVIEDREPVSVSPVTKPEKKFAKKTKIIIGCCILALLICIGIFASVTSTKDLVLNSGEPIDIYVGDEETVTISGEGLSDADYQTALWTTDNNDVLTVENGKIKASYDSDSFNEITGEGEEEDMDPCSCSTYVNAKIEKGMRKWEGYIEVNISLKPVKVESGKIIKEPADARSSSLTVTPSDDYNTYIYLESKTKKSNDMSFIIKKGEETTVSIPRDKYIMYWANGDTWYGGDFLFGPQTTYQKDSEEWDFSTYTWTLQLEATNGNMSGESVDEDDFPEL